jgi:hypothetical protein
MYPCCGYTLLWSIQPLPLLSLTSLPPTSHFSITFNAHPHILYLHILRDIADALSFAFPFPFSPSSIEQFYHYRHVLHMSLYMIMFIFVCVYLWTYLPHMRENM